MTIKEAWKVDRERGYVPDPAMQARYTANKRREFRKHFPGIIRILVYWCVLLTALGLGTKLIIVSWRWILHG